MIYQKETKKVRGAFNKIKDFFFYGHLKLSETLENSVWYCYTTYEMTGQYFIISNSNEQYSRNWITSYLSLIVTAGEFQKCNLDVGTL